MVAMVAVGVGFLVGRFVLPLLAFVGFALALHFHHGSGEDIAGIILFALGIFVVGGLTVGTIARYVTRWVRRSPS